MEKESNDVLEVVNFIKERMVTKEELDERLAQTKDEIIGAVDGKIEKTKNEIIGIVNNRIGGLENRLDNEIFARKDFEYRVRAVVSNLPQEVV